MSYTASAAGVGSVSNGVFTAGSSATTGTLTIVVSGSPNPKPSVQLVVDVTVTA